LLLLHDASSVILTSATHGMWISQKVFLFNNLEDLLFYLEACCSWLHHIVLSYESPVLKKLPDKHVTDRTVEISQCSNFLIAGLSQRANPCIYADQPVESVANLNNQDINLIMMTIDFFILSQTPVYYQSPALICKNALLWLVIFKLNHYYMDLEGGEDFPDFWEVLEKSGNMLKHHSLIWRQSIKYQQANNEKLRTMRTIPNCKKSKWWYLTCILEN